MEFVLRTPIRDMVVDYERAKNILVSALVNKADIELISETHYFDKDLRDILLKNNENEINTGNKRLPKSKPKNKV